MEDARRGDCATLPGLYPHDAAIMIALTDIRQAAGRLLGRMLATPCVESRTHPQLRAVAAKALKPSIEVIGVQMLRFPSMFNAVEHEQLPQGAMLLEIDKTSAPCSMRCTRRDSPRRNRNEARAAAGGG